MDTQASDYIQKMRQQFDAAPYPRIPLDNSPKNNIKLLYIHSLVTAYYLRNQKLIETEGKVILDAGCGTGYKALALAIANPGAKIVGIDLSEESVKLARQRLQYHGIENSEFYAKSIEDLPNLGLEFDYINADEVLYLMPDTAAALQAMKSVLKPEGIIRTNLHSSLQRSQFYQAQKIFKIMGLMEEAPGELEVQLVRETARALKHNVGFKATTWKPEFEKDDERILVNLLLQGDKGYTVPQMFSALRSADLEFVSMINWHQWQLLDLFKKTEKLPDALAKKLPGFSVEERLHLFELLHSVFRLLDFWCGHPNAAKAVVPVAEWPSSDWQGALVHIHPQLKTTEIKEEMLACINNIQYFEISRYLPFAKDPVLFLENTAGACLIPLFERPQSVTSLVDRWQKLKPVDPITLDPTDSEAAFNNVKKQLTSLEQIGFVLLERRH